MGRRRQDLDEIIKETRDVGSRLDTLATRLEYAVELLLREVEDGTDHHREEPHDGQEPQEGTDGTGRE